MIISIKIISFLFGAIGAWSIYKYGYRVGLVDLPKERSSHSLPTPKGGGIGILAAFFFLTYSHSLHWSLWTTVGLISFISFLGDKIEINAKLRLLLQVIFSAVFIFNIDFNKFLGFLDIQTTIFYWVCFLSILTFLIIYQVGTTNFYNFMDGINGIAATTGIVAYSGIGFVTWKFHDQTNISYLAFGIAIACLGFLPFNFPNAKVFMGDVGSILLGFLFAGLVILISNNFKDLICYSSFLFLFYADEITTMAERIKDKQSLISPHRRHLYQVLVNEREIAHWKVTTIYGFAQILISVLMIKISQTSFLTIFATLVCLMMLFVLINNKIKNNR
jgi:Fuc2NAc and GlcNAc transferase